MRVLRCPLEVFCKIIIIAMIFFNLLFPYRLFAKGCEKWVARIESIEGVVEVQRRDEELWLLVKPSDLFCPGDKLRIKENSRAAIVLVGGEKLRLDQNTVIVFPEIQKVEKPFLEMLKGSLHFFSPITRGLNINTPFVNAAIQGTEFFMDVDKERAFLSVFEGVVTAQNSKGALLLSSGESAITERGGAPKSQIVINPRDAVHWALYYPPILWYEPSSFPETTQEYWPDMVRSAIEYYNKGDISRAFSILAGVKRAENNPQFLICRAGLYISVGRIEEALEDIERTLKINPENTDALALKSIITLVQNKKEEALELAQAAVTINASSSVALVAFSYVQQGFFDIDGALESLKRAVVSAPGNALAWARLSELLLCVGRINRAQEAAEQAVNINPYMERTQTVLGFAYLAQFKTAEAIDSFQQAIRFDQASPLPRLGLGLAKIHRGDLEEGRSEIELAVILDPGNSILRSYLGKAYFEEDQRAFAAEQFSVAKGLDVLDPTPWFYDAIAKQASTRPVEALKSIQESIRLNDNRVVYRSRLLLDEDLAARSASLANIYNDLGFGQLALAEGWKSLAADPISFSAHRFLAGSYSVLPRHEIARVSEILQAQLLQPINVIPVQPSLTEPALSIIEGAGPSTPSFNEFNPFFNSNRLGFLGSVLIGENNTYGDDMVYYGIMEKISFSAGHFHYNTDGFRWNNQTEKDISNLFIQYALSYNTSIQAEFRYYDTEEGDMALRFDPEDILDMNQEYKKKFMRLGFNKSFSPNSLIIGSFIYNDLRTYTDLQGYYSIPFLVDLELDTKIDEDEENGIMTELRYIHSLDRIYLTAGAGLFNCDRSVEKNIFLDYTPEVYFKDSNTLLIEDNYITHTNFYLYSLINYPKDVNWTIGLSSDFYSGNPGDRDQVNPKFGVIWNLLPDTTIRAAKFRVLKRRFLANQTIEPTQIAGFNQFFDDLNITDAWRTGVAIDHKFSDSLFGGIEYSDRDLVVTGISGDDEIVRGDWQEELLRAYLYMTPFSWLAVSAEYIQEDFNRNKRYYEEGVLDMETHRILLGATFFHSLGFTARLKATYVDQRGTFEHQSGERLIYHGADEFSVIDASIAYRLPRNMGSLTIEIKNLFDRSFSYQDMDLAQLRIYPERIVFGKISFNF